MSRSLTEDAAGRARDVLAACVTSLGIRASGGERGYPEVWARDAMISLLGICADGLEDLLPALRVSLETLTAHQSSLGYVPLNVASDRHPSSANAGAIDSNLWYIIGHQVLDRTFGAQDLLERHRDAIARAMLWVRYQDTDDDGLIESQEAADWADLLANRGKVLYANVLYAMALRAYSAMATRIDLPDPALHTDLAQVVTARLNALHWVESDHGLWTSVTSPALTGAHQESRRLVQRTVVQLWGRPFYLPWVAFRDFGDWCDVLGNSLAIVAGIADARRADQILSYFDEVGVARPYPARAIHPPIEPGHKDWRDYYRNGNLNLPDQYHNGGIWPFIGGFLVAALVDAGRHQEAAEHLDRLARSLRESHGDGWEFNEWLHGRTGRPMGAALQAWSAALYLFAYRAVARGTVPCLDDMRLPRS
jgi:glycogen debranching enzyme